MAFGFSRRQNLFVGTFCCVSLLGLVASGLNGVLAVASENSVPSTAHTAAPDEPKDELALDGVLVSEKMTEIALRPEVWSDFNVLKAVKHGTTVHKGEVLVQFDNRKLEEAISDLEAEQKLAELAIQEAEAELPRLERKLALEQEAAERGAKFAEEDLERFRTVDRPQMTKSAEFAVQQAENQVRYVGEELKQLEQMYTADDLTEETEEIILKRQRDAVEAAKFALESAKLSSQETLNVKLPRKEEQLREALDQAKLALARAESATTLAINQKRFSLEKEKLQYQRSLDKHGRLVKDRELLVLRSPVEGVVYYGRNVDGNWPEISAMARKLRLGGSASANEVLLTIVQPQQLAIRCEVPEKYLSQLRPGKVEVTLAAWPNRALEGQLTEITSIPVAVGQFAARVRLGNLPEGVRLAAGMGCKIKVAAAGEKQASWRPEAAK